MLLIRNKNTFSPLDYLWNNVYLSTMLFLVYRITLFRSIFGLGYTPSMILLAVSVFLSTAIGVLLTHRKRRNFVSLFCNLTLSHSFYFICTYWSVIRKAFLITGGIALVIVGLYCSVVAVSYAEEKRKSFNKTTGGQWICSCLLGCRTLVSLVLAVLLFGVATHQLFVPPTEEPGNPVAAERAEGETIAKNIDTVLLLQEEQWSKLDLSARLSVMQTVADIETNYLGIPKVTVCTDTLDEHTQGEYRHDTVTVALDLQHLSSTDATHALFVLCHECYHAYQYRLVELYNEIDVEAKQLLLLRDAAHYKEEFANYIQGTENFEGYSAQWCEMDSNDYAEDAVSEYYQRIAQHLEEKQS